MESNHINCSDINSGICLVKLPKYLAENILKKNNSALIGYLESQKDKPENMSFTFNADDMKEDELDEKELPTFQLSCLPHQFINVPLEKVDSEILRQTPTSNSFCGKVSKRFDCRALPSMQFMKLKKKNLVAQTFEQKRSIQVDHTSNPNFNPKSDHGISSRMEKKRKEETKKIRGEKEDVSMILFLFF
ncbi:hypothetical protein HZS_6557, partial [Henneguya salminicola]